MNGQMRYCSEIQKEVDAYVEKVNLYHMDKPKVVYDLRAYAKYLKEINSNGLDQKPEVMEQFILKK